MTRIAAWLSALAALVLSQAPAQAQAQKPDLLEVIRQRGVVIIGTKADYPPFGQFNPSGQIVGLEPDLAAELARKIGVRLQLAAVTTANRLQKLQDGSVDIMIATMGDTQQRREIATLIEPNYYASGINLLMPDSSRFSNWLELRGQPVCATRGHYANRMVVERYLVDLKVFNSNRDAQLELRKGTCVGWAQDDTLIAGEMARGDWDGYGMKLSSAWPVPWAIALPSSARGSLLERLVSDEVGEWHRSGLIQRLEDTYRIPRSTFSVQTSALWRRSKPDGSPVCARLPSGGLPEECRNQALISSEDTSGIRRLGLMLKEQTGLDLTLVYDPHDRSMFLVGLLRTLVLLSACIIGGFAVGAIGCVLMTRRIPAISAMVRGLLTFSRMTPPLLQIYILFFGLGAIMFQHWGVGLDAMLVVFVCISFYAGAANAYALAEAVGVLAKGEPGFRLSWSNMPRALRLAKGPIVGSLVNGVKATGMASAIAVPEVISASTTIMAERGNTTLMMNVMMVTYFVLVLLVVRGLGALQRRLDAG
jgi:polar amino acid transport system substrate-binding protein